jgi:arginine exporter protein ArgO
MKKVIAVIISVGFFLVPIATQADTLLSPAITIPGPTAMLFFGVGLLGIASIGRKQLQEINTDEKKNNIKK